MTTKIKLTAAAIIGLLCVHASWAQDQATTREQRSGNQRAQATQQGAEDPLHQAISTGIALANQEEIALAQFALPKAQHQQVKQFAQTMIEDHQQAQQKLQQAAPSAASADVQLDAGSRGQADQARTQPQSSQRDPQSQSGDLPSRMVALQKKAVQECFQLTTRQLDEVEASQFDRCFIGQQIAAHTALTAKLRAAQSFTSGDLRQTLSDMEQTTRQHLQQAQEIAKSLAANERRPGGTAAAGGTTTR